MEEVNYEKVKLVLAKAWTWIRANVRVTGLVLVVIGMVLLFVGRVGKNTDSNEKR